MALAGGIPAKPSLLVEQAVESCGGALWGLGDGLVFFGGEGIILDG